MPNTTFAFLNCNNLDYIDAKGQLPVQKVAGLASTLLDAGGGKPPGLFGLCEVRDLALTKVLADEVEKDAYEIVLSTAHTKPMGAMGLALCFSRKLFASGGVVRDRPRRPKSDSRSYWLAVQLNFQRGSKAPLWVILNHWKSWLDGELETELKRIDTFWEVDELFRKTSDLRSDLDTAGAVKPLIGRDQFVLMAGDFNCEPGNRPLSMSDGTAIEIRRHFASVASGRSRRVLFWNTMWPAMGESDPTNPGHFGGTYHSASSRFGPRMFDHILVSKRLLEPGALIRYAPNSTRIIPVQAQSSDHAAVAAQLIY